MTLVAFPRHILFSPTDQLAEPKAREVRNYHQEMQVVYASAQPMPKVVAFAGKIGSGKTNVLTSSCTFWRRCAGKEK